MMNTTDHERTAPSLLSATVATTGRDRSDHVSILSDLAGNAPEIRTVTSDGRVRRRVGWLTAGLIGVSAVVFGMTQMSSIMGVSDGGPPQLVTKSVAEPVMARRAVEHTEVESAPAAGVIRNLPAVAEPETQVSSAADRGTPASEPIVKPIAGIMPTAAAAPSASAMRAKPRHTPARAAQRSSDSDVDIIAAIVKHAEVVQAR